MNLMNAKEHLQKILNENISLFKSGETQRNLTEKVRLEEERKNGYHGRELLELLQNVDDAYQELCENEPSKKGGTVKALIEYKNDVLTISNTGTEFTQDSIERLCQGGVSSKSGKYIGNKGTGFRAVLNWAKEIYIYSGKYAVRFSRQFADQQFNLIKDDPVVQKQMDDKRKLFFPMLYAPEPADFIEKDYDTIIKVVTDPESTNDDYGISRQIEELDYQILLFLPNITEIQIDTDSEKLLFRKNTTTEDDLSVTVISKFRNDEPISPPEEFYVFDNSNNVPEIEIPGEDEPKQIKLAVAIPKNFDNKKYQVYSFFPIRNAESPFHVMLHGSFILDQHRDSIETDKEEINKQVLKDLLDFYIKSVVDNFCKPVFQDFAIQILTPNNFILDADWCFTSNFGKFGLENEYLRMLADAKFLPTVNGDYISVRDNPKLFSKEFPAVLKGSVFPNLLQLLETKENDALVEKLCRLNKVKFDYDAKDICELINHISDKWTPEQHIEVFVWWNENVDYKNSGLLPNLIKSNEGNWLKAGQTCFFSGHVSGLPEWAKVTIINKNYQNLLENYYRKNRVNEVERSKNEKTDSITRVLTRIVNIINFQEQYTNNMISPINNSIENSYNRSVEFVKWLWKNYKDEKFGTEARSINYQFPSSKKEVKDAKSLYFGTTYNNDLGERLFCNIGMDEFAPPDIFGINSDDLKSFSNFLSRLGVRYFPEIIKTNTVHGDYKDIIKGLCVEFSYFSNFSVDYVKDIDRIIDLLDMQTIINWITSHRKLLRIITSGQEDENSKIYYRAYRKQSDYHITSDMTKIPSYLQFIFSVSKWINIAGNKYSPNECIFSDDKKLTRVFPCVTREIIKEIADNLNSVTLDDVKDIFKRLGVKERITDYKSQEFYKHLLMLSNIDIDKYGEISKRIYRQCIENNPDFNDSDEKRKFFSVGKIYAKNKSESGFYPVNQVFFSSSSVLNMSNKYLIDTHSRSGSAEKIKNYFNVDAFNEDYEIINDKIVINEEHNSSFQNKMKNILRYIFCYRVDTAPENEIKLFRNIKIELVSQIFVKIDNVEKQITDNYSIIKNRLSHWYIYISDKDKLDESQLSISIENIFQIIWNFSTHFMTDKIGELYRSDERTRQLLIKKDKGNLEEILAEVDSKLGNENSEKQKLLKILQANDIFSDEVESIMDKIDFYDYESVNNQKYWVNLLKKICWDVSDFKKHGFAKKIRVIEYNINLLQQYIENHSNDYRIRLFAILKSKNRYDKAQFLDEFDRFKNSATEFMDINSVNIDPFILLAGKFPELTNEPESEDIDKIFQKNMEKFREGKDDTIHIFLNDKQKKSLLYFDDELDFLNTEFSKFKESESKRTGGHIEPISPSKNPVVGNSLFPKQFNDKTSTNRNHKHGGVVTAGKVSHNNHQSQLQGDEAEKYVVEKLRCRQIQSVIDYFKSAEYTIGWVSGAAQREENLNGDDSLGYDIKTTSEGYDSLYIEVKSSSKAECEFYLSPNEFDFAKQHEDNYMVIFVGNMESNSPVITSLEFKFWDNKVDFIIVPTEFTVTYINKNY